MSISSTSNKVKYEGNGVTTEFSFSFKIFDESDLKIIKILVADGTEEELALTTDYSVDFTVGEEGGTVTLVSTISSDYELLIKRELDLTQELVIPPGSNLPEKNFENAYDKNTMLIQQVDEKLSRAILFKEGTSLADLSFPVPSAGKALLWNADGDGLENSTDEFNEIVSDAEAAQSAAEAAQAAAETAQSAAETAQSAAEISENNAATSESSAASSATAASTSETNAATSESNAAASENAAAISESNAATSSTEAATSATNAATSESNAADSATAAATSESNAATSASEASTSADNAALSEAAAATSASEAASAAAASQWSNVTYITSADSPVSITDSDSGTLYSVDTSSGAVVFNLPSIAGLTLSNPWVVGVKKSVDSANGITINANGSDEIDGEPSAEVTDFRGGMTFIPDTDAAPDEWTTISFGANSSTGGGGSLKLFYQESFETVDAGDFTTDSGAIGTGGGTFSGSITAETTNPLNGLQSFKYTQASGSADDFFYLGTIDVPLRFQNSKVELSGGFAYTGDRGDVKGYIYDVTNAALILDGDGNPATFDPSIQGGMSVNLSGTEQLRWVFKTEVENIGAVLTFDDIEILGEPDRNISIFASRDSFDLSVTSSWDSFATITAKAIRRGSFMDVELSAIITSTPSGNFDIALSDYTFDASKITQPNTNAEGSLLGYAKAFDVGIGAYQGSVVYTSPTSVRVLDEASLWTPSNPFTFVSGDAINMKFSVPIQGWSDKEDNVIVANTNNRPAYVTAQGNGGLAITTANNIDFTEVADNNNTWTGTTFTAPQRARYLFSGAALFATSGSRAIRAVVNGGSYEKTLSNILTDFHHKFEGTLDLEAGDTVQIRLDTGSGTLSNNNKYHWLTIQQLPDYEEMVLAYLNESRVGFSANTASTSLSPSLAPVIFTNEVFDTNDSYNDSTGVFEAPSSGLYSVNSSLFTGTSATADGQYLDTAVYVNGSPVKASTGYAASGVTVGMVNISYLVDLTQGDEVQIYAGSNVGASRSLSSNSLHCAFSIHRIR